MKWITLIGLCCVCIQAQNQRKQSELHFDDIESLLHTTTRQRTLDSTTDSRLNVLLLSVPSTGHLSPVLALGEELVRRGHDVTLCLPEDKDFSERIRDKVTRVGVRLITATGQSTFETIHGKNAGHGVLLKFPSVFGIVSEIFMRFLDTYIEQNKVHVIIGEDFLTPSLVCANHKYHVPVVFMSSTLQLTSYTYPSWPWPGMLSGAVSDDLTFLQRFFIPFEWIVGSLLVNSILGPALVKLCHNINHTYGTIAPGTYLPQIIPSVIGLEYPRTISPLTSYVGPVLTKYPDPLPTDLQLWLNGKQDHTVIYVGMGSHMHVSEEIGTAIINGISETHYSAVWALRKNTSFDDYHFDKKKFFITRWAPQLSVLGHRAIRMAILHGGANGIHEALYNEVPIIVLPHFGDQLSLAGRIHYNKLGVHIPPANLSASSISDAIREIDERDYTQSMKKLKKILVQAGGVERAADLVEYYEAVGYAHLVPAYAKYNWNWVQYYNIDVYLLLSVLLGLFLYTSYFCCRCIYRKCWNTCFQRIKIKAE